MKVQLLLFVCLLLLSGTVACNKEKASYMIETTPLTRPLNYTGRVSPNSQNASIDFFFPLAWRKTSRGQELWLGSNRLTKEAINRGIEVKLDFVVGMGFYIPLPYSDSDFDLDFSYVVYPDSIDIIAVGPYTITNRSEVYIEYK